MGNEMKVVALYSPEEATEGLMMGIVLGRKGYRYDLEHTGASDILVYGDVDIALSDEMLAIISAVAYDGDYEEVEWLHVDEDKHLIYNTSTDLVVRYDRYEDIV
jgi:hypothetical protein